MYSAKNAVKTMPTKPLTACMAKMSSESNKYLLSRIAYNEETAPRTPKRGAKYGETKPAAGVIATIPATAPLQNESTILLKNLCR